MCLSVCHDFHQIFATVTADHNITTVTLNHIVITALVPIVTYIFDYIVVIYVLVSYNELEYHFCICCSLYYLSAVFARNL